MNGNQPRRPEENKEMGVGSIIRSVVTIFQRSVIKSMQFTRGYGRQIAGALLLFFGFLLVYKAIPVIFYTILFILGIIMVYFGLKLLRVVIITDFIDIKIIDPFFKKNYR